MAQMEDPQWNAGTPMAEGGMKTPSGGGQGGGGSPLGVMGGKQFSSLLGGGGEAAAGEGGIAEALPLLAAL